MTTPAMNGIIQRLKTRGWTAGPLQMVSDNDADGSMTYLTSGEWRILLGSAPVPEEAKEAYAPSQGTIVLSTTWPCKSGASSASPGM